MEETKNCPFCGEEIIQAAIKCKHCGEMNDKPKHPDRLKAVWGSSQVKKIRSWSLKKKVIALAGILLVVIITFFLLIIRPTKINVIKF